MRRLQKENCTLLTVDRRDVDLRRQGALERWISQEKPQAVFLAAAKVGGILANDRAPAEFLYDNLAIATNVIQAAAVTGVEKLLFVGSSCIYPRLASQPIVESDLLTGPLEPTNEWYAIAKIAGVKLCQAYRRQRGCDFITAMPCNLYGPHDNFDLDNSHVVPALIRKAHEARLARQSELVIWGSGTPTREFLHVDDAADALVLLMISYSGDLPVNVGSGEEVSILDFAKLVARVVGFTGTVTNDTSKPDGTPRKVLDVSRLSSLGWQARIGLADGIADTYAWFVAAQSHAEELRGMRVSALSRGS
jgi:GDP-L-fucose synthase